MNVRKLALAFAVLGLGLAPLSFGQLASPARPSQRVLGYYDPATGVFQPLHPAAEPEATTATAETGELIVKYTISVKSTIPKNGVIGCSTTAYESGDAAGSYEERATGVATLVSGTTYTCSAIIHYSWLLDTPTTDTVSFIGSATIDYGYEVTATNGTATLVQPIESRGSVPDIPSRKGVPASGATTTVDVSVTL
ncbi:MAG: hypothetical protein WAK89_06950 [Candidatus Sulfotelmatobacter sp.]